MMIDYSHYVIHVETAASLLDVDQIMDSGLQKMHK